MRMLQWLRRPDMRGVRQEMTMKKLTRTVLVIALAGATVLGGATAFARGGDCDGPRGERARWHQMSPEQMQARMSERAEVRFARLELALALTPEQRPAWDAFKQDMQARTTAMAERMAAQRDAERPRTAIERMQRMEEMSQQRQAQMADTRKAVEAFYGTLSDAQKTVFDAEFAKLERGGRHGMGARDGARGMGHGRG